MTTPVRVNPYLPAAPFNEHGAACACDAKSASRVIPRKNEMGRGFILILLSLLEREHFQLRHLRASAERVQFPRGPHDVNSLSPADGSWAPVYCQSPSCPARIEVRKCE